MDIVKEVVGMLPEADPVAVMKLQLDAVMSSLPLKFKLKKFKVNISGTYVQCSVVSSAAHRGSCKHEVAQQYQGVCDKQKVNESVRQCCLLLGEAIKEWALRGGGLRNAELK